MNQQNKKKKLEISYGKFAENNQIPLQILKAFTNTAFVVM
jgi:hypothetical protein